MFSYIVLENLRVQPKYDLCPISVITGTTTQETHNLNIWACCCCGFSVHAPSNMYQTWANHLIAAYDPQAVQGDGSVYTDSEVLAGVAAVMADCPAGT